MQASVGKNMVLKRFHARARGRGARIEKPFAQITIVVEERAEEKKAKKKPVKKSGSKSSAKAPAKRTKKEAA